MVQRLAPRVIAFAHSNRDARAEPTFVGYLGADKLIVCTQRCLKKADARRGNFREDCVIAHESEIDKGLRKIGITPDDRGCTICVRYIAIVDGVEFDAELLAGKPSGDTSMPEWRRATKRFAAFR